MKKILLTATATAVLTTSFAQAAEGDFYGKANFGFSKFSNQTIGTGEDKEKFKAQNSGFFGIAGGYYLMNNVRAELALDYFFNPMQKYSDTDKEDSDKFQIKSKGQVNTLLVNGYVDLFDVSVVKIFAGAGVGIARIKTKFEFNFDDKDISMPITKSKISNTFSYALHLGASTEFATGIHGELVYSYRDMGKTKNVKQEGEIIPNTSVAFKAHNVAVGIRFDI
jgi:opacity protein-like surface antigen